MKFSSVLATLALLGTQGLASPIEAHAVASPVNPPKLSDTSKIGIPRPPVFAARDAKDSDWRLSMTESERKELEARDAKFAEFEAKMLLKYQPKYCPAEKYYSCSKKSCVFFYGMAPADALKNKCMAEQEKKKYDTIDREAIEYDVSLCKKYHHDPKECA